MGTFFPIKKIQKWIPSKWRVVANVLNNRFETLSFGHFWGDPWMNRRTQFLPPRQLSQMPRSRTTAPVRRFVGHKYMHIPAPSKACLSEPFKGNPWKVQVICYENWVIVLSLFVCTILLFNIFLPGSHLSHLWFLLAMFMQNLPVLHLPASGGAWISKATQATGSPLVFLIDTWPFNDASPGSCGKVIGPILRDQQHRTFPADLLGNFHFAQDMFFLKPPKSLTPIFEHLWP